MKKVVIGLVCLLAIGLIGGGIYLSFAGNGSDKDKDKDKEKEETKVDYDFLCSLEVEKFDNYTVSFIEEVYVEKNNVKKAVPYVLIKCNSLDVLKQFKDTDDGTMNKVYDEKALTIKYPNGEPNDYTSSEDGEMVIIKDEYIASYKTAGYVCE